MYDSHRSLGILVYPMLVLIHMTMKNFVERGRLNGFEKLLEFLLISRSRASGDSEQIRRA